MALLRGMPAAGADLIEIGMPFTDPMADGPIIQAAGKRALKAGVKLARVLAMVRDFRAEDAATPIILMGYLNPILSYGIERFCNDAAAAGVDGLIVVDLPTEEADMLLPYASARGIDVIRLVAPTTDDVRLPHVLEGSSGFVYYVCDHRHHRHAQPPAPRICDTPSHASARPPTCRSPSASACARRQQAGAAARIADAAVVASALIETLAANLDAAGHARPDAVRKVLDQVRALAEGVRDARRPA